GSIYLDGKNLTTLTPRALRSARARIQLVFQDPFGSLDPRVSIGASLREPLNIHHVDHGAGDGRIRQMLDLVGLPYDVVHALPADLTTSEQQRVGIARALVTRPDLVILDEPTSQLDSTARSALLRTLKDIQAELKTAYIFISHDLNSVAKISHRIAIMYLGCLVEVAPTENIIASQRHPYSRALLSAVLFPDPSRKPDRYVIQGEISSA
ncbi:MAG: ATP-binding cassette domain-containing protein, partial [Mesorhizobium sp.]